MMMIEAVCLSVASHGDGVTTGFSNAYTDNILDR